MGFLAVLLIKRVSILVIWVSNGVQFLHSQWPLACFLEEVTFSSLLIKPSTKLRLFKMPSTLAFNIGLNLIRIQNNYKTGLKQFIDLMVRSLMTRYQTFGRVQKN